MFRQQVIAPPVFDFGYDGSLALVVQPGPSLLVTGNDMENEKPTSAKT